MRLGEEGYFWEPTVEKFLRGAGAPALQYPCTKGRGPPRAWAVTALHEPQRPRDGD